MVMDSMVDSRALAVAEVVVVMDITEVAKDKDNRVLVTKANSTVVVDNTQAFDMVCNSRSLEF